MAVAGTTGLSLLVPRLDGTGAAVWNYTSVDAHATVDATDYFTDGAENGLQVGDVMFVTKSGATETTTIHGVITVTAGGAASISAQA